MWTVHWKERKIISSSKLIMINFDEEIQKFQPSLEVEDAEDAIYNNDVPDITDLISQILSGKNTDK